MAGYERPGPDGKVKRNERVFLLRTRDRLSYRQIGEKEGISGERARQIVKAWRKRLERIRRERKAWDPLMNAAYNRMIHEVPK